MKTQAFMKSFKFASASRLGEVNLRKIDKISKFLQNENISAAHGQLMYSKLQEELFAMIKTALSPPRKKSTRFFEHSFLNDLFIILIQRYLRKNVWQSLRLFLCSF